MENIEKVLVKRGYIITEEGVFLNPKGKEIGKSINNNGYYQSTIKLNKKDKKVFPHRLQAYQKYGDILFKEKIEVRHLDGNTLNNSWINIAIGDRSKNMMDIPEQIRIKKAKHASSFLKKYNNKEIKEYHKIYKSYKMTMDKFNISSKGTLNYILKGE